MEFFPFHFDMFRCDRRHECVSGECHCVTFPKTGHYHDVNHITNPKINLISKHKDAQDAYIHF